MDEFLIVRALLSIIITIFVCILIYAFDNFIGDLCLMGLWAIVVSFIMTDKGE